MAFADKTLTCHDCGKKFAFTAGEQEFYQSRGLQNEPGRCPECRTARRRANSEASPRRTHTTVCAACGAETTVPFEPRQGRPVYCSACFAKERSR